MTASGVSAPGSYRGERLGLPEHGPGSLSTTGQRLAAFIIDAIASALVAGLFVAAVNHGQDVADRLPGSWSLIPLALDYLVGLSAAGRTLGMNLVGLRVVRTDRHTTVGVVRALLRTFLLFLLVPAVIWDRDGRGLHDKYSDTAVVRA